MPYSATLVQAVPVTGPSFDRLTDSFVQLRDVCKVLGIPLIDFVRTFDDTVAALESEVSKVDKSAGTKKRLGSKPASRA